MAHLAPKLASQVAVRAFAELAARRTPLSAGKSSLSGLLPN